MIPGNYNYICNICLHRTTHRTFKIQFQIKSILKKNPHFSVHFSMDGLGIDFDAEDFKNQYADYYDKGGRTAKPSQYDYK